MIKSVGNLDCFWLFDRIFLSSLSIYSTVYLINWFCSKCLKQWLKSVLKLPINFFPWVYGLFLAFFFFKHVLISSSDFSFFQNKFEQVFLCYWISILWRFFFFFFLLRVLINQGWVEARNQRLIVFTLSVFWQSHLMLISAWVQLQFLDPSLRDS